MALVSARLYYTLILHDIRQHYGADEKGDEKRAGDKFVSLSIEWVRVD
mgnify:FL=1